VNLLSLLHRCTHSTHLPITHLHTSRYVEALGKKMGFTADNGKYHFISLGQGQEVIAEEAMKLGAKEGHWVVLENIHIVVKWLKVAPPPPSSSSCLPSY
jgi:hypothetical protein